MAGAENRESAAAGTGEVSKWLFWTCFIALVATSFGFIIRANIIGDLGDHFNLSETQKGEILGVGLWPFALGIILFSLIVDRIGYGRLLALLFGDPRLANRRRFTVRPLQRGLSGPGVKSAEI